MTPEDWQALQAAFEEATSLGPEERALFLERALPGRPALKSALARMLVAAESSDELLNDPVSKAAAVWAAGDGDRWVGHQFGSYQATRRLAAGGMSAVYCGRRVDEQFEQDVAIKILSGRMASEELVRRFRMERQILASLQHPYIARLYDGGTTEEGMPYLVMEHVHGQPIDEYCDSQRLHIDERLDLFVKVCAAVDHAHRNLIVHRDIKPSNILVTAEGIPKLLDFGIAKALDEAAVPGQEVAVTRADVRAMTPEYASPEQVRGETITTATDVYALGVLLYKLLSGRMPYLLRSGNLAEVARVICETMPSRPSTVVGSEIAGAGEAPRIVAVRATSLGKLQRVLSGDLDNIVLKTLQKEPERRYASALALSDDIGRYRAQVPVLARPDSAGYRAAKFVRRHRLGVAAGTAGTLLVTGLVAFYTWQLRHERDRAAVAGARATEVAAFLADMFAQASPLEARGQTITAEDMLDRGTERIDALQTQPAVQAELLRIIGSSRTALGHLQEAGQLLERAVQLYEDEATRDPPGQARAYMALSDVLRLTGETGRGVELSRRAVDLLEAHLGDPSPELAYGLNRLGVVLFDLATPEATAEADQVLRRALRMTDQLGLAGADVTADIHNNLGITVDRLGRAEEALILHQRAGAIWRELHGPLYPNLATSLQNTGLVLNRMGRYDEAAVAYREALDIRSKTLGADHHDVGRVAQQLAALENMAGRFAEADELMRLALRNIETSLGPDSSIFAGSLRLAAGIQSQRALYAEAIALGRRSLTAYETAGQANGNGGLRTRAALALVLADAGRADEALAVSNWPVDAYDAVAGDTRIRMLASSARCLAAAGRGGEAEVLFRRALSEGEGAWGADSERLSSLLLHYAQWARENDHSALAVDLAGRATALRQEALGENGWLTAVARAGLANALSENGATTQAQAMRERARQILLPLFGERSENLRRLMGT